MGASKLAQVASERISDETLRNFIGYQLKRSFNVIPVSYTHLTLPTKA